VMAGHRLSVRSRSATNQTLAFGSIIVQIDIRKQFGRV
jgi:hypothetical protein